MKPTRPTRELPLAASEGAVPFFARPQVLHPNGYVWLVFLSTMDIILTWIILYFGGYEVNWIADAVIGRHDLAGLIAFKFCLITLVVVICETVTRRQPRTGRLLIRTSILLTLAPVTAAFVQLLYVRLFA